MRSEPVVVLLVGIEVVQYDVNLSLGRLVGDHLIEEGLEVRALLCLRCLAADDGSGDLQRGKQVDGAWRL